MSDAWESDSWHCHSHIRFYVRFPPVLVKCKSCVGDRVHCAADNRSMSRRRFDPRYRGVPSQPSPALQFTFYTGDNYLATFFVILIITIFEGILRLLLLLQLFSKPLLNQQVVSILTEWRCISENYVFLKSLQFMHHRNFVASVAPNPLSIHPMLHEYLYYQEKIRGFC